MKIAPAADAVNPRSTATCPAGWPAASPERIFERREEVPEYETTPKRNSMTQWEFQAGLFFRF